MLKGKESLS